MAEPISLVISEVWQGQQLEETGRSRGGGSERSVRRYWLVLRAGARGGTYCGGEGVRGVREGTGTGNRSWQEKRDGVRGVVIWSPNQATPEVTGV
jgi:hypothetical protein